MELKLHGQPSSVVKMSNKIDASERRLNLVIALLGTRRGYSKHYIRENINGYARISPTAAEEVTTSASFERMFERDKETLRELGIPIGTTFSQDADIEEQAIYRISPSDYSVPEVRLDEPAMTVLAVAANLWAEASFGEAAQSALRKIASRTGVGWYDDDATVQSRIRTHELAFEPLWTALRQSNPVRFSYRSAGTEAAVLRSVHPWGLGSKYGEWYLIGFDTDKAAQRNFRLSRIGSEVTIVEKTHFERPENFSITSVLNGLGKQQPFTATVRVPRGSAHSLRSREGTLVSPSSDGGEASGMETLSISYREAELMADDLAALGSNAIVLDPINLRAAVLRRLESAAAAGASVDEISFGPILPQTPAKKRDSRDRLVRLLSMVPFLISNPGIDEADLAAEFNITLKELSKDLETLTVSGLPGYLHGDLMDVSNEDGQVFIRDAETLSKPLRLSQEEACALLVGLEALAAIPGTHAGMALGSAIEAVKQVAGEEAWLADAVALELLSGSEFETLTALQSMIGQGLACQIKYLVRSRDEVTERVIEPRRIYSIDSRWYVRAWCRRSGELRSFRVDNIHALNPAGPQNQLAGESSAPNNSAGILYNPGVNDITVHLIADSATARKLAPAYGATLHQLIPQVLIPPGNEASDLVGIELLVGESAMVAPLMARLAGQARVATPAKLRAETAAWLAAALAGYEIQRADDAEGENIPGTHSQSG